MPASEIKVSLPTGIVEEFVQLLTSKEAFNKWKAISLGLEVAKWLLDNFGISVMSSENKTPPGRMTNKKVAAALSAIAASGPVAKSAIPLWLLPIVIKLLAKWLAK